MSAKPSEIILRIKKWGKKWGEERDNMKHVSKGNQLFTVYRSVACRMRHPNGTLQLLDQARRHFNVSVESQNNASGHLTGPPDAE